jgi:hypothetical protein
MQDARPVSAFHDARPDEFKRFEPLATIDGYDVIDSTSGRPVDHRPTLRAANGVAFKLNNAAAHSPRALLTALGASR